MHPRSAVGVDGAVEIQFVLHCQMVDSRTTSALDACTSSVRSADFADTLPMPPRHPRCLPLLTAAAAAAAVEQGI